MERCAEGNLHTEEGRKKAYDRLREMWQPIKDDGAQILPAPSGEPMVEFFRPDGTVGMNPYPVKCAECFEIIKKVCAELFSEMTVLKHSIPDHHLDEATLDYLRERGRRINATGGRIFFVGDEMRSVAAGGASAMAPKRVACEKCRKLVEAVCTEVFGALN